MIRTEEQFNLDYIDASSVSTFARCPAKFMFSRMMGLSHPDSMRIALDYGTDMHSALPYCYGPEDEIAACLQFDAAWGERDYGEEDPKRNCKRAHASLEDFCESHTCKMCPYEIINFDIDAPTQFDRISPNEVPFLIDIGGPLSLAGRIDIPVRWKQGMKLWALDYKTTSEISARYFNGFHNSPQTVAYTLALSHIAGEICEGMIIEAIRSSKTNAENQLHLLFVQPHQIESFISYANRIAGQMIAMNDNKIWFKRSTGCGPYSMFGQPGYYCEYRDLCDYVNWKDGVRFYKRSEPFHPFKIRKG